MSQVEDCRKKRHREEGERQQQEQATIEKAQQVATQKTTTASAAATSDARSLLLLSSASASKATESFALIDANVEASIATRAVGNLSKVSPDVNNSAHSSQVQVVETTTRVTTKELETSISKVNLHEQEEVRLKSVEQVKNSSGGREVNNNEPIVTNQNSAKSLFLDCKKSPLATITTSAVASDSYNQRNSKQEYLKPSLPGLKMDISRQIVSNSNNSNRNNPIANGKQSAGSSSPQSVSIDDHPNNNTKQQQKQPSQTNSIPSYNSIFNSSNNHHHHHQNIVSLTPKATDLDEEILPLTTTTTTAAAAAANKTNNIINNKKLSQKVEPQQKRRWSPLLASADKPASKQLQQSRAPLKKQQNAHSVESAKKLLVFNYEATPTGAAESKMMMINNEENKIISYVSDESVSCYDYEDEVDNDLDENEESDEYSNREEEEEENEEEINERLPFNNVASQKHRNSLQNNLIKTTNNLEAKFSKQNHQPGSASLIQSKSRQIKGLNSSLSNSSGKINCRNSKRANESNVQMSNSSRKLNNNNKISFINSNRQPHQQFDHKQQQQQQATNCCRKIDFNEQSGSPGYLNCDCNSCSKKRKLVGFVQGHGSAPALAAPSYYLSHQQLAPHHHHNSHNHNLGATSDLSKSALLLEKGYPKTRVMHLVLKSIILVLCTLLLLLLLVGTAMLSLTLPQAVDKITNVSRSFNVTIAGRR